MCWQMQKLLMLLPNSIHFRGLLIALCLCVSASIPLVLAGDDAASAPAADIYNKAVHFYEIKRWDAAREHFHQYLAEYSETPLYITCLYYLAYCYQQLQDKAEAISIYHKVIDLARDEELFWAQMAERRINELGGT